jgi:hypothetical protein
MKWNGRRRITDGEVDQERYRTRWLGAVIRMFDVSAIVRAASASPLSRMIAARSNRRHVEPHNRLAVHRACRSGFWRHSAGSKASAEFAQLGHSRAFEFCPMGYNMLRVKEGFCLDLDSRSFQC